MKLKLDFDIPSSPQWLSIEQPLLLFGSCFAEDIGKKMRDDKFNVCINPSGILFNPLSIFKALKDCSVNAPIDDAVLFQHNDLWHSWEHHSRFSSVKKEDLIHQIKSAREEANNVFNKSEWIIITLGSAWVYELISSGQLVANCHKVPQASFRKRLLEADEMVDAFNEMANSTEFRGKKFLFTVSPVRYIRDGLAENNLSKAQLLTAVHRICNKGQAIYFPSYEIVMDELRDYRFFEPDMVHPNETAIDYVYEKFESAFYNEATKLVIKEVREVVSAFNHRTFQPDTPQHQKFLQHFSGKVRQLAERYPYLRFEEEIKYFG